MPTLITRRDCLAAAAAVGTAAFAADTPTVSRQLLAEDVGILQAAYEALHPGLLRYNSRAEMDGHFATLRRALAGPRTLGEAYLAFAGCVARVRCGHSFLNPANQSGAALRLISGGSTRLPFRFRWIGDRMIVLSGGGAALAPGTEVVAIGGVRCAPLLRDCLPFASADGHNDAKRVRETERRGDEAWEAFDIFLPLLHPDLVAGGLVRLTLHAADGKPLRPVEVGLLTRDEALAGNPTGPRSPGGGNAAAWQVERLPNGVAWLAMPTWAVFDSKWDWRAALNATMDQIALDRAPALIVDLRGNRGGLDVGDLILARLVDRDVPKTGMRRLVRYRRTPPALDRYMTTWDNSFRDWGNRAVGPDAAGFYQLASAADDPDSDRIRPQGRRYNGKVIVIVDASNSSATFSFAEAIQKNNLGTLVGQTTGGNRRGMNGGAFFFLQLPGSGLEIDLPLIGYFPTSPQPDAAIEPEIVVTPSVADIARGIDAERAAALRLAA